MRLVVLASGNGSNLQSILDACTAGRLDAEVAAVVSDRPLAGALRRAHRSGVPTEIIAPIDDETRRTYDIRLAEAVRHHRPDLVVLAGWMRILSSSFLDGFPDRVINLHPALPGEYPGIRAIERAFQDAQRGARSHTGVMVHLVPDEGVDDGPVIAVEKVPIDPSDTVDTLTERIHEVEHRLLVDAIAAWTLEHSSDTDPTRPRTEPT